MDKKSKIFLWLFLLAILVSVGVTYYKIMIKRDYAVETQVDCDPTADKCFVWQCDPNSEVEGEKCGGDPEKDLWYYKIIRKNASRIPLCDPSKDENCQVLICEEGESECEQIFCNDENKKEQGVECNDPVKYTEENPTEEEAVECEEGDVECESAQ